MSKRHLTILEIDHIISSLTFLETSNVANKALMIDGFKSEARKNLETIKIVPYTKAIALIGEEFINAYLDSQIPESFMAGSLAAEALTRDLTQDSLNGKKNTGKSKNKITELDKFKEVVSFTNTEKSKMVTTKLYFKTLADGTNPNFNYLLDQETNIKELTIEDIVLEIYGPESPDIFFKSNSKEWYTAYEKIWPTFNIYDTEWFVRFKIDIKKIFRYKLTLGEVCDRLRRSQNNLFECIHSPIFVNDNSTYGYIDIYPIDSRIVEATKVKGKVKAKTSGMSASKLLNKIYLTNILIDELNIYVVAGINHISSYSINKNNILDALDIATNIVPSKWKLWLNYGWLNYRFLDENFVLNVLKYLKLPSEFKGNYILVTSKENPIDIIKKSYSDMDTAFDDYVIDTDTKRTKDIKNRNIKSNNFKLQPPGYSGIKNSLFNSYYVKLGGTNLAHLFMIRSVDTNRTLSQDLNETYRFFGISITRNLMIARLIEIFDNVGIWVDNRHIMLLVDYMCFPGYPVKIGYYGATYRNSDPMVRATMKYSAATIAASSLFGVDASVDTSVGMSMTGVISTLGKSKIKTKHEETITVEPEQADINLEEIINLVENLSTDDIDDTETENIIMDPIETHIQNKNMAIVSIPKALNKSYDRTILGRQLYDKPTFNFSNCHIDDKTTQFPVATLNSEGEIIFTSIIDIDENY